MPRILVGLTLLVSTTGLADDPPPPSPNNPVDYVKWCNEQYAKGIKTNAADLYDQALEGPLDAEDAHAYVLIDKKRQDWTAEDKKALNGWFARNDRRVALFVRATRIRRCFFESRPNYYPDGLSEPAIDSQQHPSLAAHAVPNLQPMHRMVTLFLARARLRFHEGDSAGGAQDVCTALRAARHLLQQPLELHYMTGVSRGGLAYSTLRAAPALSANRLDYTVALEVLRREDLPPPKPLKQLDFELIDGWDVLQRFLEDSDGDGLYDQYTAFGPNKVITLRTPVRFQTAVRNVESLHRRWRRVYSLDDYSKARRIAKRLQATDWDEYYRKLFADEDLPSDAERRTQIVNQRGPQAIGYSHQWTLLKYWRRLVVERNTSRIILCMHTFKAEHDRWPRNLQEATQGETPDIRRDPFSGKDLAYRIEAGQPLLYSVGDDGDDDNGRRAARYGLEVDGDWVFWPPK